MPSTDLVALPKRAVSVRTLGAGTVATKASKALVPYQSPPRFKPARDWPFFLAAIVTIGLILATIFTDGDEKVLLMRATCASFVPTFWLLAAWWSR